MRRIRENLTYGATRGCWKREDGKGYLGTQLETMETDKPNPVLYRASALLYYPHAKKIHLIWDQAGYHICREVQEFLKTSRIKIHYLPPRSPNLNPIERLWKIMHEYEIGRAHV